MLTKGDLDFLNPLVLVEWNPGRKYNEWKTLDYSQFHERSESFKDVWEHVRVRVHSMALIEQDEMYARWKPWNWIETMTETAKSKTAVISELPTGTYLPTYVFKQRTWNPDLETRLGLLIRYYGSTEDSLDTGCTRNKVQLQFSALGSAVLQASHVPDFFILHIKGFNIYRAGRIN